MRQRMFATWCFAIETSCRKGRPLLDQVGGVEHHPAWRVKLHRRLGHHRLDQLLVGEDPPWSSREERAADEQLRAISAFPIHRMQCASRARPRRAARAGAPAAAAENRGVRLPAPLRAGSRRVRGLVLDVAHDDEARRVRVDQDPCCVPAAAAASGSVLAIPIGEGGAAAPRDEPLVASSTQWSPSLTARCECRSVGAGHLRLGHREAGADLPVDERSQVAHLLLLRRVMEERVHVALVGRVAVEDVNAPIVVRPHSAETNAMASGRAPCRRNRAHGRGQRPAARARSRSSARPFRHPPSRAKRASAGATSFRMKSRTRSRTRTTSGGSVKSIAILALYRSAERRRGSARGHQPLGDLAHRRNARPASGRGVAEVDLLHDDAILNIRRLVPGGARRRARCAPRSGGSLRAVMKPGSRDGMGETAAGPRPPRSLREERPEVGQWMPSVHMSQFRPRRSVPDRRSDRHVSSRQSLWRSVAPVTPAGGREPAPPARSRRMSCVRARSQRSVQPRTWRARKPSACRGPRARPGRARRRGSRRACSISTWSFRFAAGRCPANSGGTMPRTTTPRRRSITKNGAPIMTGRRMRDRRGGAAGNARGERRARGARAPCRATSGPRSVRRRRSTYSTPDG